MIPLGMRSDYARRMMRGDARHRAIETAALFVGLLVAVVAGFAMALEAVRP